MILTVMAKNKWNGPPREARCLLSEGLHSVPQIILTLDTDETLNFRLVICLLSHFSGTGFCGGFDFIFFFNKHIH